MSVDLHKYAYAAKGASVVLYRNRELRRHQFFVTTDWAGGIYASPAMLGTRPGGSIAAAWAIINHLGEEGYLELNKQVMDTVQYMRQGIEAIPELKILGDPHMSVMAMASDELDIYSIGDEMSIRGWHMDRQQDPASLHLTISFGHTISKDEFIKDLQASVAQVKKLSLRKVMTKTQLGVVRGLFKALPNPVVSALTKVSSKFGSAGVPKRSAAMYGMMGALPEQGDLKELVIDTLDKMFKV
jgi:glutamate/tyrosine decarboxylase-like PLP-dependent enzyme